MKNYIAVLLAVLITSSNLAFASPFDDWDLEQIKSHPEYESISESKDLIPPSSARESAASDAPYCYEWIGQIKLDRQTRVVFDSHGHGVTMENGVPQWAMHTIDYLTDRGLWPNGC